MELNLEQIIREYIDKSIHMSFATAKDNKPWVCELHFTYDDDLNLYFRSLKTRRHSMEIAENPFVSGNIVKQHQPGEGPHGIYFEGTAKLCDDPSDFQRIYECFKRRLGSAETIIEEAKRADGHQFYKVTVSDWYAFGTFGGESNEKYHLPWKGAEELGMITRLSHTALEVEDIEASVKFYESMGFQVVLRFDKPEPRAKAAHLTSQNDMTVELWQFLDKSHPQVKFIRRHIAVESDNLEADLDTFVKQGCQIVIPITKGVTMTYAFIRDLDGNYIEVAQK